MKNKDITKKYRTRLILNLILSVFSVCIAESLLVMNYGRIMYLITRVHAEENYRTFRADQVVVFLVLGAVLFAVVFYLLQRRSLSYIRSISEGIGEISEGNLDHKIEIQGDDEFSEMAASVNQMSEDLKKLLQMEREAEQQKTELITNIAHDLRTPLTSILGYLELLSGKNYDLLSEAQKKSYLKIAYAKAKRLEQLIFDLFDFTRLSYGRITMKMEYVDLVKLLEQLLEEAYPSFHEKGLRYEFLSNVPAQEIMGDSTLIARMFANLIENAVKYGADGKKVVVRLAADRDNDTVSVQVINYGFVIEEKDIPHIFEKFYRADKARSSQTGGTGLGLAIVRNIAEMHDGSVSVQSDLNGTVFTVRLKIHFRRENESFKRA